MRSVVSGSVEQQQPSYAEPENLESEASPNCELKERVKIFLCRSLLFRVEGGVLQVE